MRPRRASICGSRNVSTGSPNSVGSSFGQPRFSQDAISQFQIITNRFDATAGRSAGVYVNAAMRDPFHPGKAPSYESGAPTDNNIGLWRTHRTGKRLAMATSSLLRIVSMIFWKPLGARSEPTSLPASMRKRLERSARQWVSSSRGCLNDD